MRIIAGQWKGRKWQVQVTNHTRPTTDFVREALAGILESKFSLSEVSFLDLFAGTGAVSFELRSRGCLQVTAIEKNTKVYQYLKAATSELEMQEVQLIKTDAYRFLSQNTTPFDIIFADPPYADSQVAQIPDWVFTRSLLSHAGLLIIEHDSKHFFDAQTHFREMRKYGNTRLSFFSW